MDISNIRSLEQMKQFLKKISNEKFTLSAKNKEEIYTWINGILVSVKYLCLPKKQKGIVIRFIKSITNYSDKQIKRLIRKYKNGNLSWKKWQKNKFKQKYNYNDVSLLHKVDAACECMSGKAVQKILQRNYKVFGLQEYERLSQISVSHIYNLRKTKTYKNKGELTFKKTNPSPVKIGKRTKPNPNGQPGYFRVDTVHQGDFAKKKGMYHINCVDEVLQFEFVFSVPAISEKYMKQVLEMLYQHCPYIIINFHSDNGSEFINYFVANWLQSLHINQTKSRARKHNDNALVESKNGAVIRKHFGYFHIPANEYNSRVLNDFNINWFIPYLNYHRPCAYAELFIDKKGKKRKVYNEYETPYEKLKSLNNASKYLRRNISFDDLDSIAYNKCDTEFAQEMKKMKIKTFSSLKL